MGTGRRDGGDVQKALLRVDLDGRPAVAEAAPPGVSKVCAPEGAFPRVHLRHVFKGLGSWAAGGGDDDCAGVHHGQSSVLQGLDFHPNLNDRSLELYVSSPAEPSRWRFREVLSEIDATVVLEEDFGIYIGRVSLARVVVNKVGRHQSPDPVATVVPPRRVVLQLTGERVEENALGPRGGQKEAAVIAKVVGIRNEGRGAVQCPAAWDPGVAPRRK